MNVHIRSRPYKCRLAGCDADFNELSNRNAHEKGVHKFSYKDLVVSDPTVDGEPATAFVIDDVPVVEEQSAFTITI